MPINESWFRKNLNTMIPYRIGPGDLIFAHGALHRVKKTGSFSCKIFPQTTSPDYILLFFQLVIRQRNISFFGIIVAL